MEAGSNDSDWKHRSFRSLTIWQHGGKRSPRLSPTTENRYPRGPDELVGPVYQFTNLPACLYPRLFSRNDTRHRENVAGTSLNSFVMSYLVLTTADAHIWREMFRKIFVFTFQGVGGCSPSIRSRPCLPLSNHLRHRARRTQVLTN